MHEKRKKGGICNAIECVRKQEETVVIVKMKGMQRNKLPKVGGENTSSLQG